MKTTVLLLHLSLVATATHAQIAVQAWVQRCNGPANDRGEHIDRNSALVVDGNGQVFVSGSSWNGTNHDYMTIKYSAAGTPCWTNLFNVSGNTTAQTSAIAIDCNGNVICYWIFVRDQQ